MSTILSILLLALSFNVFLCNPWVDVAMLADAIAPVVVSRVVTEVVNGPAKAARFVISYATCFLDVAI